MEKLLFTAYSLDVGGIEKALVNLLNNIINEYDITLILEKKQGLFLNDINPKVKIVEYKPNQNKNLLIRKVSNVLKRIKFIIKNSNKFNFGASFATYSKMGSFCARVASKNNALWIHSNYLLYYKNNKEEVIKFFKFINYNKFKKYVFVSENSRQSLETILPQISNNSVVIHNLINYNEIIRKSKEPINLKKEEITTFLSVARHEEDSKRITRLFEAAEKLKTNNMQFRIILIGSGPDTKKYKKIVNEKILSNNVIFLGTQENPYPYFLISDAIILTSEYEGYPVVFDEARALNVPIITTNISDSKIDIDGKFGTVCEKNVESIYLSMKNFIEQGYTINKKFNAEEFNEENVEKLKIILDGRK